MSAAPFSISVQCPYCGEMIEVVIEYAGENQQYIEDCQVCCQPINFLVTDDGLQDVHVRVFTDNDV